MKTLVPLLQLYVLFWQMKKIAQDTPPPIPDINPVEFTQPFLDFVSSSSPVQQAKPQTVAQEINAVVVNE